MTETTISPEETFDRLMADAADPRRKRSLEALHETCRLLFERGSQDFTYENIVLLGKDRSLPVPGKKSIVNSTGQHYRELINAWKLQAKRQMNQSSDEEDWVSSIDDPVIRMSVNMLLNDLKAAKARNARKTKYDGVLTISNPSATNPVPRLAFTQPELNALKAAIDPDILKQFGLIVGSRGELIDTKSRTLFKPGFRDAIEKILSVTGA